MGLLGRLINLFSNGPAIQNLDSIDMKVDLKDGGVILPIVASKHLDDTDDIRYLISQKLQIYFDYLDTDYAKGVSYFEIEFNCIQKPSSKIIEFIEEFEPKFQEKNATIKYRL